MESILVAFEMIGGFIISEIRIGLKIIEIAFYFVQQVVHTLRIAAVGNKNIPMPFFFEVRRITILTSIEDIESRIECVDRF
jgi:hypothetical protein